jgi:Sodium:sulfate symporter transmembrane region
MHLYCWTSQSCSSDEHVLVKSVFLHMALSSDADFSTASKIAWGLRYTHSSEHVRALRAQGTALTAGLECRAAAFLGTVALWVGGAAIGVNNVAAALCGLAVLLITGVVSWKECLSNNGAWDTLTWFAALIAMAAHLNKFGFIPWFSDQVRSISYDCTLVSSQHYCFALSRSAIAPLTFELLPRL